MLALVEYLQYSKCLPSAATHCVIISKGWHQRSHMIIASLAFTLYKLESQLTLLHPNMYQLICPVFSTSFVRQYTGKVGVGGCDALLILLTFQYTLLPYLLHGAESFLRS